MLRKNQRCSVCKRPIKGYPAPWGERCVNMALVTSNINSILNEETPDVSEGVTTADVHADPLPEVHADPLYQSSPATEMVHTSISASTSVTTTTTHYFWSSITVCSTNNANPGRGAAVDNKFENC